MSNLKCEMSFSRPTLANNSLYRQILAAEVNIPGRSNNTYVFYLAFPYPLQLSVPVKALRAGNIGKNTG